MDKTEQDMKLIKMLLLYLLNNDQEIREKIFEVASAPFESREIGTKSENKEFEKLKRKNIDLEEEKKSLDDKVRSLSLELKNTKEAAKNIQSERNELEKEIEKISTYNADLQKKLHIYEQKLKGANAIEEQYELYNSLPEGLRKSMAGIINGETLWKFLISGAQAERQDLFWEFCRTEVQKSTGLTYAETLRSLFVFFSQNIASLSSVSLYELYEPIEGSEFKNESMIPSNSGSQSGYVEQVILPGLKGVNTGKINKKAIVKLKDRYNE